LSLEGIWNGMEVARKEASPSIFDKDGRKERERALS
jgi:hypothetical protein